MLQGDDLSLQLFIGAAAISFLSVAMTQAGWTHGWFVRGMFALAALLAIVSVGWRYFEARIPLLSDTLQTVASGRIAWFFSGIIPALIAGMLLSDFLRRRREGRVRVLPPGWVSVDEAMQTFARQDLLDRNTYVGQQIVDLAVESEAVDKQIAQLNMAILAVDQATRSQWAEDLVRLTGQQSENRKKSGKLLSMHQDCHEALRMNIFAQLQAGDLIAKGFLAPHTPGSPERIVPMDEWRFLILDAEGQALDPTFEYIAILIGKPDRPVASAGRKKAAKVAPGGSSST
jgi:hypothetical protein